MAKKETKKFEWNDELVKEFATCYTKGPYGPFKSSKIDDKLADFKKWKQSVGQSRKCCICSNNFTGFGNNAEPVVKNGICCDSCNTDVLMARVMSSIETITTEYKVKKDKKKAKK